MNVNPAPTPEDREGFAAFLLRLRGKGSVPKALVAAFEATPRRMFLAGQYHPVAWSDRMLPIECGEAMEGADLQAAVMKNGLGARLNARWQSATHVFGGTTGDDLNFSDLTTVSARLFADLGQRPIARKHPFFRGSRVALSVDNLFDQRQKVTAANGLTPVSYQPDLLDPYGRTIRLSFRKIFF